jgi:hypothetical protein
MLMHLIHELAQSCSFETERMFLPISLGGISSWVINTPGQGHYWNWASTRLGYDGLKTALHAVLPLSGGAATGHIKAHPPLLAVMQECTTYYCNRIVWAPKGGEPANVKLHKK